MNLKKKLKKFFTLKRRADDGFTLVELIVVIAIMAILAGVGTVGYGGYIKSANKNADKVLVGNIIRAIETGTNSTMFETGDSFTKGDTVFPVGVITLTTNGCEVQVSGASRQVSADAECEMDYIDVVPEGAYTLTTHTEVGDLLNAVVQVYEGIEESELKSVPYCKTHANVLYSDVYTKWTSDGCKEYAEERKTYVFEKDCVGAYDLHGDHKTGDVLTEENLSSYGVIVKASNDSNHPIYDALVAAFGDVPSLKLSYDGWGGTEESDSHTFATLYTYTDTLMQDINEMASTLITAVWAAAEIGKDVTEYLSDDYSDAADMADSFAVHLISKYPDSADWDAQWAAAANGDTAYAFGLEANRDFTYAARKAYNISFASYCAANNVDNKYVEVIKDYHHTASGIIPVPDVVNTSAFANKDESNDDSLYKQFKDAGDQDGAAFDQCAKLFEQYKKSEVYAKNGKVFYDTMSTLEQTGSDAFASGVGGKDAYFKYYENYMKEISAFYELLNNGEETVNGIMILVTVQNGNVVCEVSPSAANPRND